MYNYNKTCTHSRTHSQHPPFCFRSTILLFSMQCFIKSQVFSKIYLNCHVEGTFTKIEMMIMDKKFGAACGYMSS